MHSTVLQLDIQGTPQAWIGLEQRALHYAAGCAIWEDGAGPLATLRGGWNVAAGRQSRIEVAPIVAVRSLQRPQGRPHTGRGQHAALVPAVRAKPWRAVVSAPMCTRVARGAFAQAFAAALNYRCAAHRLSWKTCAHRPGFNSPAGVPRPAARPSPLYVSAMPGNGRPR
jgi:hypothetical protein